MLAGLEMQRTAPLPLNTGPLELMKAPLLACLTWAPSHHVLGCLPWLVAGITPSFFCLATELVLLF